MRNFKRNHTIIHTRNHARKRNYQEIDSYVPRFIDVSREEASKVALETAFRINCGMKVCSVRVYKEKRVGIAFAFFILLCSRASHLPHRYHTPLRNIIGNFPFWENAWRIPFLINIFTLYDKIFLSHTIIIKQVFVFPMNY